jgi:hypothetical protein
MKKKKEKITENVNKKRNLNETIEKKHSFHSIDNTIKSDFNLINNSSLSKNTSYYSVRQSSQSNIYDLEQSMLELKDYIEIVAPSDSEAIETVTNKLTFRPKNLPKKSKEEEDFHRKLVEENRKLYLESLQKKQIKEMKYKKRLEKKLIMQQKLSKIWLNEILPNWSERKKDKNIKEYFYQGLPDNVRGRVWMLCLGNKFSITKEYYEIQVKNIKETLEKYKINNSKSEIEIDKEKNNIKDKEKSINIIELDIERTFPYLGLFKGDSPMAQDLREILRVFVISRPDIGYIQGLSFIAGILLLNMDKFKAFISLMNLILNPIILPFYKMDNESIQQRLQLFKQVFYFNLPELCEHFDELNLLPENYFLSWNMTLFTRDVNLELAKRIWDVFMVEGIKAIYSAAIVFLSHFEDKLLKMDFVEIMTYIGSIKNINFDEDMVIEAMKNVKIPDWIQVEIDKLKEDNLPIY